MLRLKALPALTLAAGSIGLSSMVLSVLAPASAAHADPLACPDDPTDLKAVASWRDSAAKLVANAKAGESQVEDRLAACFPTAVPDCLGRLSDYLSRDENAPSETDLTEEALPEKQPPAELFAPAPARFSYNVATDVERIAAAHGWPSVRYKSRMNGGFDPETPSLLMVYVPGDKVQPPVAYDRWLNFPLPADTGDAAMNPLPQAPVPAATDYAAELHGGQALPRTFTMVSLDRAVGDKPGQVYFQKFYRASLGSPTFVPQPPADLPVCVSCHPSGLRAISPLGYHVRAGETQLPPDVWQTVKAINDAMSTAAAGQLESWREGVTDQVTGEKAPLMTNINRGPALGAVTPLNGKTRTKSFIMGTKDKPGCYAWRTTVSVVDIFGRAPGRNNVYKLSQSPDIDWKKVSDAMQCGTCHDGQMRPELTDLVDASVIDFKILVDQSMPNGAHVDPMDQGASTAPVKDDLTPDERIALANCLQAEYAIEQDQLQDWLTQDQCTASTHARRAQRMTSQHRPARALLR